MQEVAEMPCSMLQTATCLMLKAHMLQRRCRGHPLQGAVEAGTAHQSSRSCRPQPVSPQLPAAVLCDRCLAHVLEPVCSGGRAAGDLAQPAGCLAKTAQALEVLLHRLAHHCIATEREALHHGHLLSTKLFVGISSKPIWVKILRNCALTCTQNGLNLNAPCCSWH